MDIYIIYFIFLILLFVYIIIDTKNENIKSKIKFHSLKQNVISKKNNINKFTNINSDNNNNNNNNINKITNINNDINLSNKCTVSSLNTEQCYKSKYYECPNTNGSYLQCTNNYIPKPDKFNALCDNRTFELSKQKQRLSENCYYNLINYDRNEYKLNIK
jgi:hypothetical protein